MLNDGFLANFFLCPSITKSDTFIGAQNWCTELKKQVPPECIVALVGNKSDLVHKRQIDLEMIELYAKEQNMMHFESSAKNGENIKEIFTELSKQITCPTPQENIHVHTRIKTNRKFSFCW